MRVSPLVFVLAFRVHGAVEESPAQNTPLSVEGRRAEAMGKPMGIFRTMDGRVYREVVISRIDGSGISFKHADGAARLRFDDLSPGQRKHFGIDRETASGIYRRESAQRAAYEQNVARKEEERRITAEREASDMSEIRRLESEIAASLLEMTLAKARLEEVETIPSVPNIKRLDTSFRITKRYSPYGRSYLAHGYGYSFYRPAFRSGYSACGAVTKGGGFSHYSGRNFVIGR